MKKVSPQPGFGLVEAVITVGISSVLLLSFMTLVIYNLKTANVYSKELTAHLYATELIEATKDLEQSNWVGILACASPCHPEISGNAWILLPGEETLGSGVFTRSIVVEDVFRDQLAFPNTIVTSSGVSDPNTKKVVASVLWNDAIGNKITIIETYVYKP
jgi:type II secretory pathway pseudopilin PulG